MRMFLTVAVIVCATSGTAQEPALNSDVLQHALRALPQHLLGLVHHALPDGSDMTQYAIADATVGGAEQSFGEYAAKLYGTAIADELLASYRDVSRASMRIEAADAKGARVLALDEFAAGPASYDWERLHRKHPDIRGVLRISAPATAGGYALVRVEVIGPQGLAWFNVIELQRQPDGSWLHTRAIAGGPPGGE